MSKFHIHGGPVWGSVDIGEGNVMSCCQVLYRKGRAMVSFNRPDQLKKIIAIGSSVVLDNGAFSVWMKAQKLNQVVDWSSYWTKYYQFVLKYYGSIDWFIIPDVIEGSEKENDALIKSVPSSFIDKAVPVWHSNESLDKLVRLCETFKIVAIGCCGDEKRIRSKAWAARMDQAFCEIYVKRNLTVKIHGLRMLDGRVMIKYPFDSCDSTNVAINVPKDKARFPEVKCKLARTAILRNSIESITPPTIDEWTSKFKYKPEQGQLF